MYEDAERLKDSIENVFGISVRLLEDSLEKFFITIPEFEGYYWGPKKDLLAQAFCNTAVLLLTVGDIYGGYDSKDDEWAFGSNDEQFSVVATARLMGPDNRPRSSLGIEKDLYMRRLSLLTIHELGHDLVKAPHHQDAAWVNVRNGTSMLLGPHCDDNTCAMYELVDITAPPRDEGYPQLGDKCLYDAGMDEHLARLRPDWFCSRCRAHIVIPDSYQSIDSVDAAKAQ